MLCLSSHSVVRFSTFGQMGAEGPSCTPKRWTGVCQLPGQILASMIRDGGSIT